MSIRERIESDEARLLSPQATLAANSRGRERPEAPHPYRTAFQRDRDRILHSKAFRRLAHKTQVFLAPEGDHYRVRLTHTLEVSQIARTIARALRLNEDLVEAIALGHDLGHTPFGHLGEEVLTEFLGQPFRHNEQSLRVVDRLERRGDRAPGLNLSWEVRDGILNHTWSMPDPATMEAKIARFADRIAYISHDIDDAVRAGVLAEGDLPPDTLAVLGESSSERIDSMVGSLVETSRPIGRDTDIRMSAEVFDVMSATRQFLFDRVYLRPEVAEEQIDAHQLLAGLCLHYEKNPGDLPDSEPGGGRLGAEGSSSSSLKERIVDYVAGMTDRFAKREHERIAR